jgi:hypothetical protein
MEKYAVYALYGLWLLLGLRSVGKLFASHGFFAMILGIFYFVGLAGVTGPFTGGMVARMYQCKHCKSRLDSSSQKVCNVCGRLAKS